MSQLLTTLANCSYFDRDIHDLLSDTGYTEWEKVEKVYGSSGFEYLIYKNQNTDEYVIAFTGTDDGDDAWIDVTEVGVGISNTQKNQAITAIDNFAKSHKNAKFYITGHSLGGYLAQWVAGNIEMNKLKNVKSSNFINL